MSDIKKYKIKLVDKENSISLIKSFLSKYDYKKGISMAELKIGYTEDQGQIYSRQDINSFSGCNFFYMVQDGVLVIELFKEIAHQKIAPDEKNIRLVENLVIDLKIANNYNKDEIPSKRDISDIEKEIRSKKIKIIVNDILFKVMFALILIIPVLFILMLVMKFSNKIINYLLIFSVTCFLLIILYYRIRK